MKAPPSGSCVARVMNSRLARGISSAANEKFAARRALEPAAAASVTINSHTIKLNRDPREAMRSYLKMIDVTPSE